MEVPLHPLLGVPPGTFSILVAPEPMLIETVERTLERRRRAGVLYICGNYSRLLSRLDRHCADFHIQRAFTAFQLLSILEEADSPVIAIEHDPTLYDDVPEVIGQVVMACLDRAQMAAVVILSPSLDMSLGRMARRAHRVVYVDRPEGGLSPRRRAVRDPLPGEQLTLEEVF